MWQQQWQLASAPCTHLLHHYSRNAAPHGVLQWFDDLGGFEKEENVKHFVNWSIKAVELFGSRVKYWATFNEPTVSAQPCGDHTVLLQLRVLCNSIIHHELAVSGKFTGLVTTQVRGCTAHQCGASVLTCLTVSPDAVCHVPRVDHWHASPRQDTGMHHSWSRAAQHAQGTL